MVSDPNYQDNSMQQQAGLIPPWMPQMQVPFSGQSSAMVRGMFSPMGMGMGGYGGGMGMGGYGGGMGGGMFPNAFASPISTFTNAPQFLQGAGGVMMPIQAGGMSNPMAGQRPQYGQGGAFPTGSIYSPAMAAPPPMFMGAQGQPPGVFIPPPPSPMFDTPFQGNRTQAIATVQRENAAFVSAQGMGARLATNAIFGAIGGAMGGPMGALAGFAGSEALGLGRMGQNMFMRNFGAPQLNEQAYSAGLMERSRSFISGGPAGDISGQGLSLGGARDLTRQLTSMAGSRGFQRETMGRFNTADVMKITESSMDAGLMTGAQNPAQMRSKVQEIAKSLTSFMELAQEPDVRRAIQTMGQMHAQGLNLNETLTAVRNGRSFARMAGTSFSALAEMGGAMGAQTFQSMGLTQGLGFQTGMMNAGIAQQTQNLRLASPQMMNLVGGAQGLGAMNTMFSAGMLQMPMLAPAMMSQGGGLNVNAMQNMMSGGANVFQMAGQGAANIGGMTGRMGAGGLGMALSLQPMIQDAIGRALQAQGPMAQRGFEDRTVMGTMRSMGMRGSEGFVTAARIHGMDPTQALIRAQELASPEHWSRQRDQIEVRRRERADEITRGREMRRPGLLDEASEAFEGVGAARRGLRSAGRAVSDFFSLDYRATAGFGSGAAMGEADAFLRGGGMRRFRQQRPELFAGGGEDTGTFAERAGVDTAIAQSRGAAGIAARIAGLLPMDETVRRNEERTMRQRSLMAQTLLGSGGATSQDRERAAQRFFGGGEGQRGFAQDVLGALGAQGDSTRGGRFATNLFARGVGAVVTGGDIGNVSQQQMFDPQAIQRAAVNRMMQSGGMSRQAAEAAAQANMPQMLSAVAPMVQAYGTAEQIRNLEASSAQARVGRGRIGGGGAEGAATRRFFGADAATSGQAGQRHLDALHGLFDAQGRGVGRTPERQAQSRRLMAAITALQAVQRDPTTSISDQQRAGQRAIEVEGEMERLGFTPAERDEMRQRAVVGGRRISGDRTGVGDEQRQIGRSMLGKNGREIAAQFTAGGEEVMVETAQRQMSQGLSILGRQGGVLGQIFGSARNTEEAVAALSQAAQDPSRMAELRRVRPDLARIAQARSRGEDVSGRVDVALRGIGEQGDRAREAFRHRGFFARLGTALGIGETEEQAVTRAGVSGTEADQIAQRERGQAAIGEEEAQAAGIGGAGDSLLQAARELSRAAAMLSGTADSGELERLSADPGG